MCNDVEVTPYVRPPSTRKVLRLRQAQYLTELTTTRELRATVQDYDRVRALTLDMKIRALTRGHTKDPAYQAVVADRKALQADYRAQKGYLWDQNKVLWDVKAFMKEAERVHLEALLAHKTPVLTAAFGSLTQARAETEITEGEYRRIQAEYRAAQDAFEMAKRKNHEAQVVYDREVKAYHAYMKGRVRKKAKKVVPATP